MSLNAKKIGHFDPAEVLKKIESLPGSLWQQDRFRSSLRGLEETQSILIQYDSEDPLNIDPGIEIRFKDLYNSLGPALEHIRKRIPEHRLVRVFVARLPAQKKIGMHIDPQEYSRLIRYHWVLQTNSDCQMIFRRERFHFAEGEIWFFNNLTHHAVANEGNTERVHVIFDFERAPQ